MDIYFPHVLFLLTSSRSHFVRQHFPGLQAADTLLYLLDDNSGLLLFCVRPIEQLGFSMLDVCFCYCVLCLSQPTGSKLN